MVFYSDLEPFPCDVIRANIARGRLPEGTVLQKDICELDATALVGFDQIRLFAGIGVSAYACRIAGIPAGLSLLCAGFPCQDISVAGKGAGLGGARSGLFWELLRIIEDVRPTWLLLENVPALRTAGAAIDPDGLSAVELVIHGLEGAGYCVLSPTVVGADDAGAPHRRKRVWIVARRFDAQLRVWGARKLDNSDGNGHMAFNSIRSRRNGVERASGMGHSPGQRNAGAANATSSGLGAFEGQCGESAGTGAADAIDSRGGSCADVAHSGTNRERNADLHPHAVSGEIGARPLSASGSAAGDWGRPRGGDPTCDRSQEWLSQSGDAGTELPATERTSCFPGWPARPGEEQRAWEAPRSIELGLGSATDGAARRLERDRVSHRRHALKALGNAWCVWTAVPYLLFIRRMDREITGS